MLPFLLYFFYPADVPHEAFFFFLPTLQSRSLVMPSTRGPLYYRVKVGVQEQIGCARLAQTSLKRQDPHNDSYANDREASKNCPLLFQFFYF
jgi:hypothetical protein